MQISSTYQHFKISSKYQHDMKFVENLDSCWNRKNLRFLIEPIQRFSLLMFIFGLSEKNIWPLPPHFTPSSPGTSLKYFLITQKIIQRFPSDMQVHPTLKKLTKNMKRPITTSSYFNMVNLKNPVRLLFTQPFKLCLLFYSS